MSALLSAEREGAPGKGETLGLGKVGDLPAAREAALLFFPRVAAAACAAGKHLAQGSHAV